MLDDSTYKTLPFRNLQTKEIATKRVYLAQDNHFNFNGFATDNSDGNKKGWAVWVVADKPLAEQNDQILSLIIHRAEMNFENNNIVYEIKEPNTPKNIIGGLYIIPEHKEVGHIVFNLSGILHFENNKWNIVRIKDSVITEGEGIVNSSGNVPNNPIHSGLTPIVNDQQNETKDNNKKNKK